MNDPVSGAPERNPLLLEIGKLVLQDSAYSDGGWQGIALVYTSQTGALSVDGYRYNDDGPDARTPEENSGKIMDVVENLHAQMQAETGNAWHQMLYQIWMPGPDFRATFEYDNPKRWSLGSTTADGAGSYAELIDPQNRR